MDYSIKALGAAKNIDLEEIGERSKGSGVWWRMV